MKSVITIVGVVALLVVVGWRLTYEMRLPAARIEFATSLLEALGAEDREAFAEHPLLGGDIDAAYDTCRALVAEVDISEPPVEVKERDPLTMIAEFPDGGKVIVPVFDNDGELYFAPKLTVWPAKESSDER